MDSPELDLTPRTGPADGAVGGARPRRSRGRSLLLGGVIVVLLGGIVALLVAQVQGSSVYYYNVDEAVEQRADLGERDIRIQGTVVGDPVEEGIDDAVVFALAFDGASVDVRHVGPEPPPLFEADVPAVLEGNFLPDGTFRSERIVIKHSEEYREDNPDHVEDSPA